MPAQRWNLFRTVEWGAVWLVIVALVLMVVLARALAYVDAPSPAVPTR